MPVEVCFRDQIEAVFRGDGNGHWNKQPQPRPSLRGWGEAEREGDHHCEQDGMAPPGARVEDRLTKAERRLPPTPRAHDLRDCFAERLRKNCFVTLRDKQLQGNGREQAGRGSDRQPNRAPKTKAPQRDGERCGRE